MFTHEGRLRHLLRPAHYTDEGHFAREVETLFRPAWHFVGTLSEMSREGEFRTTRVLGTPVLLRNFGGRVRAFRNVCPHRHAMLSSEPCGQSPTLRCQYHGWEFREDGRTARIPEASAFRPWDRENSRLDRLRLESCGDLLFVTLSETAPPLTDWLRPYAAEVAEAFDPSQWRMRHAWDYRCECNWKVPAENTLESYHVTSLHPQWFGKTLPRADRTTHTLEHRFTALDFDAPPESRIEDRQARLRTWLGGTATRAYRHRHLHPHFVFCTSDTLNYALTYHPIAPRKVEVRVRLFAFRGTRRGPAAALASEFAWRIGKRATLKVHGEDRTIYADQQAGLEASPHPGVLGNREERVFHFQRYVLEAMGLPMPEDPAAFASGRPSQKHLARPTRRTSATPGEREVSAR